MRNRALIEWGCFPGDSATHIREETGVGEIREKLCGVRAASRVPDCTVKCTSGSRYERLHVCPLRRGEPVEAAGLNRDNPP